MKSCLFKLAFRAAKLISAALIFTGKCFCSKVEFPVCGIEYFVKNTVPVTVEWDENQFGKNSSYVYNHNLARIAAIFADNAYVDANRENNQLYLSYKAVGIQDKDISIHYDVDYEDSTWGINQCAFSIASKKINSAKGVKTLIFLIIRGTPLSSEEWDSNLNLNNSKEWESPLHEGFYIASKQILLELDNYISNHNINSSDSFIMITGHSRGASVANLTAALLSDSKKFSSENIYAFTFASPNVTKQDVNNLTKYNFIWNIVNAEDLVPNMPFNKAGWTYQKFGNTLTLANAWNKDLDFYINRMLPKMNELFSKFYNREYHPFKTGPFVPIYVIKFLSKHYSEPENFYQGNVNPHNVAVKFISKAVFPKQLSDEQKKSAVQVIDGKLQGKNKTYDSLRLMFFDMHTMETYLSWMLTFDESELFSDEKGRGLIFSGDQDCLVLKDDGTVAIRIKDSKIEISSMERPVVACPFGLNKFFIGLPENSNYKIIISSESMTSNPVKITSELYSSSGSLLDSTEEQKIYTSKDVVYEILAEKVLKNSAEVKLSKLSKQESRDLKTKYKLRAKDEFHVSPEFSWDLNNRAGFGMRIGTQSFFGTVLNDFNFYRIANYASIWTGFGTQQRITGALNLDAELFARNVFVFKATEDDRFYNLVPALRLGASIQPGSKKQIFFASVFEFNIEDFNDSAFENCVTRSTMNSFSLGQSINVYPTIQFGIRF